MAGTDAASELPEAILARARVDGGEYAWSVEDIPEVIKAARAANLVSLGGQLQFRLKNETCECYWVEVDVAASLPNDLPWAEKVIQAATIALRDFTALRERYDFLAEGRAHFSTMFDRAIDQGETPESAMVFVWHVTRAPAQDVPGQRSGIGHGIAAAVSLAPAIMYFGIALGAGPHLVPLGAIALAAGGAFGILTVALFRRGAHAPELRIYAGVCLLGAFGAAILINSAMIDSDLTHVWRAATPLVMALAYPMIATVLRYNSDRKPER